MDDKLLQNLKYKLELQKYEAYNLLKQMERNETIKSNSEMSAELSLYDNHPADSASSIYDKERGMALEKNEKIIIRKIEDALKNIETGTYGICEKCGKNIEEIRLESIPYTEYCIDCQRIMDNIKPAEKRNRPVEEKIIKHTLNLSRNSETEFDAEDSYQCVGKFNRRKNIVEEYEDEDEEYVEPIEKISNEQYKNQLY